MDSIRKALGLIALRKRLEALYREGEPPGGDDGESGGLFEYDPDDPTNRSKWKRVGTAHGCGVILFPPKADDGADGGGVVLLPSEDPDG